MKSARRAKSIRLVSDGFVHRSRTITRTIWSERYKYSRPGRLRGFRLGHWEGLEAKVVSAVPAEHDSVGHLLESRCAGATSEVFEALRERACRSIEDADVIEREVLAGLAAPLNSCLLSVHNKLGNSHSLKYSRLEDLAATVREYCLLFAEIHGANGKRIGPGLCHGDGNIQHFPTAHSESSIAIKANLWRFALPYSVSSSDCLPDVRQQVSAWCCSCAPVSAFSPPIERLR